MLQAAVRSIAVKYSFIPLESIDSAVRKSTAAYGLVNGTLAAAQFLFQ